MNAPRLVYKIVSLTRTLNDMKEKSGLQNRQNVQELMHSSTAYVLMECRNQILPTIDIP